MAQLTSNAVADLIAGKFARENPGFVAPVVQVINVKLVASNSDNERYRVIVSDGIHYAQGMLATQMNQRVHDGSLKENCVIRLEDSIVNVISGRMVVILLGFEVIRQETFRIGSPEEYKPGSANSVVDRKPEVTPSLYQKTNNGTLNNNNYGNGLPQAQTKPYSVQSSSSGMGDDTKYGPPQSMGNSQNPYGRSLYSGGASSNAPIVQASAHSTANVTPISALNMYQNHWTIKARVTSKTSIKSWNNARGQGTLFSCTFLDRSGTDIRATFFKEAVDKFYPLLEVGGVYTASGGRLKVANAQYNNCKSAVEVSFDERATIERVSDGEGAGIEQQTFDFCPIRDLERKEPGVNVDILAMVVSVGQPGTIMSRKKGTELKKCEMTLADDSGAQIQLTLWGDDADTAPQTYGIDNVVVACKSLRLGEFGGRSLGSTYDSTFLVDTPHKRLPGVLQGRVQNLRAWWSRGGGGSLHSLSSGGGGAGAPEPYANRKTLSAIKEESLGYQEKPDWITVKATFNFIKKDKEGGPWYTACINDKEPCRQRVKVTPTTDGQYHCDRCNTTYPTCTRRFIFSATLMDHTSTSWCSVFDDQAKTLFSCGDGNVQGDVTADELYRKCFGPESSDMDAFESVFSQAVFTEWIVKCKVKQELVGDEQRVKATVASLSPIDYVSECRELLKEIQAVS